MKKILLALVLAIFAISFAIAASPDTIGNQQIGGKVTFGVTADGTQPFTYQWNKNGSPIAGATASTYVIQAVAVADAGTYTVTVTNSAGSAVSNNLVFTVTLVPPANVLITVTKG